MTKKKKIIIISIVAAVFLAAAIPPAVILLKAKFHKGNSSEYSLENTPALENSPLRGKKIIFLGSSVTVGSEAKGVSFVDYMEKRDGIIPLKEAVGGTVMVDKKVNGKASYIERMKNNIDKNFEADAFVCQLSTNDATKKLPLGEKSQSTNIDDFDTRTIAGAIEYIISYAKTTWNCPVIFYTGTKYNSSYYGQMVDLLLDIQTKWDIGVIDLWNDPEMNAVSKSDYNLYMVNGIHPSQAGYRDWWTPKFETYITSYLGLE